MAAIEFDASMGSEYLGSWQLSNFPLGSGSNRIALACMAIENNPAVTHNGVTFNSVSMTQIGSTLTYDYNNISWWYLLEANLPAAGNYNVVFSPSAGTEGQMFVLSLKNVKQGPPEAIVTQSGDTGPYFSTDITTLTDGAWVVDGIHCSTVETFTADAGQVEREDEPDGSSGGAISTKLVASAGLTTIGQTLSSTTGRIVHSLFALAPVPEAQNLRRTIVMQGV